LTAVGQIIPQGVFFCHAPPGFVPGRGFDHFANLLENISIFEIMVSL